MWLFAAGLSRASDVATVNPHRGYLTKGGTPVLAIGPASVAPDSAASENEAVSVRGGVCMLDEAGCHDPIEAGIAPLSDLSTGVRAVDDFSPTGTLISEVCWWGIYFDGGDCGPGPGDDFQITVYDDAGGLPGVSLSSQSVIATQVISGAFLGLLEFEFTATLPTAVDVASDGCYWIEITNNTTGAPDTCNWFWSPGAAGNSFSLHDIEADGVYDYSDQVRDNDLAFCVDTPIAADDCGVVLGSCCLCPGCALSTMALCPTGLWQYGGTCTPSPCPTPANDPCMGALPIVDGITEFDTFCTTTDGPSPLFCDVGDEPYGSDIWYTYTATCDGLLTVSLCDNTNFDAFVAIHSTGTTACACPPAGFMEGCADESCLPIGLAPSLTVSATFGDCYTIRVGGWDGAQGIGEISITCGSLPNPPTAGDNTCQTSAADLGTPCNTNADCPVAGSACGSKSRYLSITPGLAAVAGDTPTSIQVQIVSMPQFPSMVGDIYYAGVEQSIPNAPNPALRGAPLQCTTTPNAQIWTEGVLHVFGPPIVPGSLYNVRMCDASGTSCSNPLLVATGKWGDVVRGFGSGQPNFTDVSSIVQKFTQQASAPSMPRVDLVGTSGPGTPNTPNQVVNFTDVAADVNAFAGFPYPYTVPACP